MNFKFPSVALLSLLLIASGCGEPENAPALPGPVQVSGDDFVAANEYRFTPGSILETTSLSLDFINPTFDRVRLRSTPSQGTGEARQSNIFARISSLGSSFSSFGTPPVGITSDTLALSIGSSQNLLNIRAFTADDALLTAEADLSNLVLVLSGLGDPRIQRNTVFRTLGVGTRFNSTSNPTIPDLVNTLNPTDTDLRLTVENIYVSRSGDQLVIDGSATLIASTLSVRNTVTGISITGEPPREEVVDGQVVNTPGQSAPVVNFTQGRFSASFNIRQRGIAGDGSGEDPLSLLARLNFVPNQAELVYRPTQVGTTSVLFAPDPQRTNILPNQLVRIRRLLNGRIQAEFDPSNISSTLNFVQVAPPPGPFPTPIPQLPLEGADGEIIPRPGPPTAFDYFFSLRTERPEGDEPVTLSGFVPTTGDFIFRNLAGSQLAGPFNRADIGGGVQRGNLNLVFSQSTKADQISGEWFLEQEFPTANTEVGPEDPEGAILIIRGSFSGSSVRL